MKYILFTFLFIFSTLVTAQNENKNYDPELAKKYGADDYGMKMFIFVILKSGDNKNDDKAYTDSCFAGHMSNINRLVEEKKLIVAGPMGPNDNDYRGIFILDVKTKDEAKKLLASDPAISSGLLEADMYEWYGSAALAAYLDDSDKVWKINP